MNNPGLYNICSVSQLTFMRKNEADVIKVNMLMATPNRWKFNGWTVCSTALLCFAAGSLMVVGVTHANEAKVDSNLVFELLIHHTLPGKVSALESLLHLAS